MSAASRMSSALLQLPWSAAEERKSVEKGAAASGTIVGSGGLLYGYFGATVSGASINGGTEYDYGTANGTTISQGGAQFVELSASGTVIDSGGAQFVYGTANATTVNSGGDQFVYGVASGTTLNGGTEFVYGLANATTVSDGGFSRLMASPPARRSITAGRRTSLLAPQPPARRSTVAAPKSSARAAGPSAPRFRAAARSTYSVAAPRLPPICCPAPPSSLAACQVLPSAAASLWRCRQERSATRPCSAAARSNYSPARCSPAPRSAPAAFLKSAPAKRCPAIG